MGPAKRRGQLLPVQGTQARATVASLAALAVTEGWLGIFQDVDAAYANKVELQAKVDSMDQEIKFFKCLYEAVSLSLHSTPLRAAPKTLFWGLGEDVVLRPLLLSPTPELAIHFPSQLRETLQPLSSGWERNGSGPGSMVARIHLGPRGNSL